MQILIRATNHVDVAPPAQVSVSTLVASLQQCHALLITIVRYIFVANNIHHVAVDVALIVRTGMFVARQGAGEVVKAIAPIVVAWTVID